MDQTIAQQEQNISAQQQKNLEQEQKIVAQEQKIFSLETANSLQQQIAANLSISLEDVKHTETGRIGCESTEFYNGGTSTRGNSVTRTFNRPYSRLPAVFLSVNDLRGYHHHGDTGYFVYVSSVSETQFSVTCYAMSASQIGNIEVSYLAIPRFD